MYNNRGIGLPQRSHQTTNKVYVRQLLVHYPVIIIILNYKDQ